MKTRFLRRTRRERLLILVLLAAAGLVWLASASRRLGDRWREARSISTGLATQQLWLGRQAEIEARATRAAANLDPSRTLDAIHLVGEIAALAGRTGLTAGMEPPRTQRTGQFAYHTVQVNFRRAEIAALVQFYRELGQRAPYLALEECQLTGGRANPAELDAVFTVFSVEVEG